MTTPPDPVADPWMGADEFEELVADALEQIPAELLGLVDNCLLVVEDRNPDEVLTTVVHEIAHFFGIDDDRLHHLGWG